MRRLAIAALALVSAWTASCSHLSVQTEVFLKDLRSIQDRATVIQRSLEQVLAANDGSKRIDLAAAIDEAALEAELEEVWDDLLELAPDVFVGTPEDFSESFLATVRSLPRTTVRRSTVEDLLARAERLSSEPPFYASLSVASTKIAELEQDYAELARLITAPLDQVTAATKESFGGAVRDYYTAELEIAADSANGDDPAPPATPPGEEADGETATAETEADAAAGVVARAADEPAGEDEDDGPVDPILERLKALEPGEAQRELERLARRADRYALDIVRAGFDTGLDLALELDASEDQLGVLPLTDPAVPSIVSAPDAYWKGVYGKVRGCTWFGNAEIAIRMEDLGQFHMKGVTFDPSRVTKAALDGIGSAVKIVAAAYGVPVPQATESKGEGGEADPTQVTRSRLQAQLNELKALESRELATRAESFYKVLGRLQGLPTSGNVANVGELVDELAVIVSDIQPEPAPDE